MASSRRKRVVASRRRREDDGEEEGSVAAELEDDSLSEGSIISNGDDDADIEPSDISEDENVKPQSAEVRGATSPSTTLPTELNLQKPNIPALNSAFIASSDTNAMMNGLKLDDGTDV